MTGDMVDGLMRRSPSSIPFWGVISHLLVPALRHGPRVATVRLHRSECFLSPYEDMDIQTESVSLLPVWLAVFTASETCGPG